MSIYVNRNKILIYIILIYSYSCKPPIYHQSKVTSISISEASNENKQAQTIIAPYKESLDKEMNEVLVLSSEEFPKEKGKVETKLGNLVADLSLEVAQKMYDGNIDFCLLNFGGLRTSLPKGEITKGKIFELMPFENELVVVTISKEQFDSLINYLKNVGPQPVAGIKMNFKNNDIKFKYRKNDKSLNTTYKIVTSDYLANGGDKMNFFLNPINTEKIGIKLRDAIIEYCTEQNKQGNQLTSKVEGRIVYE